MLVSQSLVFIHLTKCGGNFVRNALHEVDGPEQYAGRFHGPWSEIPNQYSNMPVITAVRNPYDWWVSWYHFMKKHNWPNPIARAAVITGNESFPKMLQFITASLTKGSKAAIKVDRQIQALAEDHSAIQNDFTGKMIEHMRLHQCGILSWRFSFQLLGIPENQLTILNQDSLLNDLKLALKHAGCEFENNMLTNLPKANTTARNTNHRNYYVKESRIAVARLDRLIIEKFNYQF